MREDVAHVAHRRRESGTDLRKILERAGNAWALLVIQIAVGQEVEARGERDDCKTLLFRVQHVRGGVVGNQQVKGVVVSWGLRPHVGERIGNGSVFECIKTEEPTRATGRISSGFRVTIQQCGDHAMFVDSQPRAASEEILSAVYPGGVPQAEGRRRGTSQGFVAISRGDDRIARKHLKVEGEGAHDGGGL